MGYRFHCPIWLQLSPARRPFFGHKNACTHACVSINGDKRHGRCVALYFRSLAQIHPKHRPQTRQHPACPATRFAVQRFTVRHGYSFNLLIITQVPNQIVAATHMPLISPYFNSVASLHVCADTLFY